VAPQLPPCGSPLVFGGPGTPVDPELMGRVRTEAVGCSGLGGPGSLWGERGASVAPWLPPCGSPSVFGGAGTPVDPRLMGRART